MTTATCEQLKKKLATIKYILAEFSLAINQPIVNPGTLKTIFSLKKQIAEKIEHLYSSQELKFDHEPIIDKLMLIVLEMSSWQTMIPKELKKRMDDWITKNITINRKNKKVIIATDLYWQSGKFDELPDNITVKGNLDLQNSRIKKLPDFLTVEGYLSITHTSITELPDTLHVGKTLFIDTFSNLQEQAKKMQAEGRLKNIQKQ